MRLNALSRVLELVSATDLPVVVFENVSLAFDDNVGLREVSFSVRAGEMEILLGASGSGQSVTLKLILGLLKPDAGVIRVNGERIDNMSEPQLMRRRADRGMLFREGAPFDSLTVADNVGYRLYEEPDMPAEQVRRRVEEVRGFIGLGNTSTGCRRSCQEGSGGASRLRVRWHRQASPLLFDEPTSGLEPITATTVDKEIVKLGAAALRASQDPHVKKFLS